jgi:hypothetical protein
VLDYVRISQETHLQASTACYEDSFIFLEVDYVRIKQEADIRASTVSYGDSFSFYMLIMFVPYRKHTYGHPWHVMGLALLSQK